MITIDSDPKLNPVYIGAAILSELSSSKFTQVTLNQLYKSIKDRLNISYEVFTFSLDWLYVIGAIDISEDGQIEHATTKT